MLVKGFLKLLPIHITVMPSQAIHHQDLLALLNLNKLLNPTTLLYTLIKPQFLHPNPTLLNYSEKSLAKPRTTKPNASLVAVSAGFWFFLCN